MKKTLILQSVLFASLASAADLTLVGGGTTFDTTNYSTTEYNRIIINAGDNGFIGNSGGTFTVINAGDTGNGYMVSESSASILASADYTFSEAVLLKANTQLNPANGTKYWATTLGAYVKNGATLTFEKGLTLNDTTGLATCAPRFSFVGDGTGSIVLNQISGTFTANGSLRGVETVLDNVNITLKNTAGSSVSSNYFHLGANSKLTLETDLNVSGNTFAIRNPIADGGTIGTVYMNGHTITARCFTINAESKKTGVAYFDFANGDGKLIVGDQGLSLTNANGVYVEFLNFDENDKFYSEKKLDNTMLSHFIMNGMESNEILETTEVFNGKTYFSYYVIPEPSTYAMIFGALALAFALYRRK